ncbi:hypothetical protein DPMN_163192 [Dreissena polymorpha]|uniref:Uncharacterized protein n=1 Tax=Dreissena polymorpha TaxID=45954 RepID=A0A9D4ET06_DREPO|nr:hypothetical protein DPMN_163192 [Dreissena polymorpha]
MTKESIVMDYFGNLESCLTKQNLLDKPHLVFNVDEKGITCEHKPQSIIARADHYPPAVTSGKGKTVTLIDCGSASKLYHNILLSLENGSSQSCRSVVHLVRLLS